jgi:hypothetical protein
MDSKKETIPGSGLETVRKLRLPPPDFSELQIPSTREPARDWFRVHQSGFPARYFSLSETHRFSHPACPYPSLYLGIDAATCLFERFGEVMYDQKNAVAKALWRAYCVSMISVPAIQVCDLTNSQTLSALRVDLGALMHHDLKTPQQWGLAIQRHPANFQAIKFKSRFNDEACLALFHRDGLESQLRETLLGPLTGTEAAADWLHANKVSLY